MACLLFFYPAFAQTVQTAPCTGLDHDTAPAEQAVCWFNNDTARLPICAARKNDANPCITQTNAWCAHASLDEDRVTTACMMAAIRVGQLTEAKEIAKYLRSPSPTAATCAAALKRATLRIFTNPAGAEVVVNGRSYGRSHVPVEPTLTGPWWKSKITAVFVGYGYGYYRIEAEVSPSELLDAFDRRECVFGDLIVANPHVLKIDTGYRGLEPPLPPIASSAQTAVNPSSRSKTTPWVSMALAGTGVLFSATAIGLLADGKKDNNQLGNTFLIIGSVCLLNAMALYLLDKNTTE